MGLGLHYGPVVAGDIGSRRTMAFATVGDTTNVTRRLQPSRATWARALSPATRSRGRDTPIELSIA